MTHNRINENVTVTLTTIEIAYINDLLSKDELRPLTKDDRCPYCGRKFYTKPSAFCDSCGQRIDGENTEF